MGKRVKKNSAIKFRIINENTKDGFVNGRRSGKDRRKISTKEYFLKGGLERRSWKERRKSWYMTM
jgi:hypothetical protein